MIRINLLASRSRQARASSPSGPSTGSWLIGYGVAALVLVVGLAFWYYGLDRELNEVVAQNNALQQEYDELSRHSANIDQVRAALARSQRLEEVVNELQRARFGPTRVLMELAKLLSLGGGPTIDPQRYEQIRNQNPLAGYNPAWDHRRLWLVSFQEEERHVRINGQGKTNEDVAEFLRRLSLSDLFGDVTLDRTEAADSRDSHVELISFQLSASVRY